MILDVLGKLYSHDEVRIIDALQLLNLPGLQAEHAKPVIAVAAAAEPHVLQSVVQAYELGIADFILFGDVATMQTICRDENLNLTNFELVNVVDPDEAAAQAVTAVATGKANVLMKGLVETSPLLRAVLHKENGIRGEHRISHLAMFAMPPALYPKPLFLTDAAVNIAPDQKLRIDIIENAVAAMQDLGVAEPKVALVCGKEKVDAKMPITAEYAELTQRNETGWLPGAHVYGPLALDGAISPAAASTKGIEHHVAGDADLIVCPDMAAGNMFYKALTIFGNLNVGSVLLGAKAPIIISSRSDTAQNKLLSIALGAAIAENHPK